MSDAIRVLHVVGKMDRAGAETLLMNLYRRMDRSLVQFDFLTHRPEAGDYDAEIEALGGHIYHAPVMKPSQLLTYEKALAQFWSEHHEFVAVHSHIDAMSALPLRSARRAGVACRIAHSHNTAFPRDTRAALRFVARELLCAQATELFACSAASGEFLFPKRLRGGRGFEVLQNGVALDAFRFTTRRRTEARAALALEEALVFGHVGRFCAQKNHMQLLEIFKAIHTQRPNSVLLLVGEGEQRVAVQQRVAELGLTNAVRFLGVRSDISDLMHAMDVFLLPSLHEGFPVVGVEAQATGLPCLFSQAVKPDIALTTATAFVPLAATATEWATAAFALAQRTGERSAAAATLAEQGFDIAEQAQRMQAFYLTHAGVQPPVPAAV